MWRYHTIVWCSIIIEGVVERRTGKGARWVVVVVWCVTVRCLVAVGVDVITAHCTVVRRGTRVTRVSWVTRCESCLIVIRVLDTVVIIGAWLIP